MYVCVLCVLAQVLPLFCPVCKKRERLAGSVCLPEERWLLGDRHRLALGC